jgi:ankyrin repeat protein
VELAGMLLEAGADVNARIADITSLTARIARTNTSTDRQGQTTLFFAAEAGRAEVVRYLLDHGARTDVKDTGSGAARTAQPFSKYAKLIANT